MFNIFILIEWIKEQDTHCFTWSNNRPQYRFSEAQTQCLQNDRCKGVSSLACKATSEFQLCTEQDALQIYRRSCIYRKPGNFLN